MKETPKAHKRCISRFEGQWYIAWWIEGRSTVTLTKTTPMPGDGFLPQEDERSKRLGYMYRKVPACEVEAFPTVLYKGEVVGLDEMDPEASSLRVKFFTAGFWIGAASQTAARVDRWRVFDQHDNILESPYMDPEDPRLELIPGPPVPRSAGPLPVPVVPSAGLQRPPDPATDRCPAHNRFIARHGDQWYIALWNVGDPVATLIKTRTMPGEGFAHPARRRRGRRAGLPQSGAVREGAPQGRLIRAKVSPF